jgi:hypothetical protein
MKYIITEKQFKKISDLVLKEQGVPQTTPLPLSGVTINGIKYKSPKIKTQIDLDAFTAPVQDELVKIVDYGRMKGYTAMRPFTQGGKKFGDEIRLSIPEFLRVNAILGNPKPINFSTLKTTMEGMSKSNANLADLFKTPISVLGTLLQTNTDYAASTENIFNYYQNLLRQRLS